MIIAVPSHSNTWAGSIWGHIAIFIGDGKAIENIGRINVRGLNDWVNYYIMEQRIRRFGAGTAISPFASLDLG